MISLQNLSKTYADGTRALNDISLELPRGMVGLLGPNGAGKSSLMRTLACLQAPDSGDVLLEGRSVLTDPTRMRQQLGYLPQHFGVYPYMSCVALLGHIASLKNIPAPRARKQIDYLLSVTNLTSVANKNVSTFSGGMRQRFGIAQALLGEPRVVIMDEPTAGLDPQERQRLHSLLITLSEDRLILLSTHIVEDIENLCPFAAVINRGRIVGSGTTQALLAGLQGKVWETGSEASTGKVLGEHFRYGKPYWRIFADAAPTEDATLCEPVLQDRYFLTLAGQDS